MKELLKELGFEHLPMYLPFTMRLYSIHESVRDFPKEFEEYARFISQPLTKGMFVACDQEGNVLVELHEHDYIDAEPDGMGGAIGSFDTNQYRIDEKQYQQAKERVLFETDDKGCVTMGLANIGANFKTIEHAINAGVKLKLK